MDLGCSLEGLSYDLGSLWALDSLRGPTGLWL